MSKKAVLLEVAGGESLGLFKVGGRTFRAQPLKIKESKRVSALYRDGAGETRFPDNEDFSPLLADFLTARSQDGDEVTADWLEDNLTGQDYGDILSLLQNPTTFAERKAAAQENPQSEDDTKNVS